jgi:4,5-DOPA dioxygenase extradiol
MLFHGKGAVMAVQKKHSRSKESKDYPLSETLMPVGFVGHGAPTLALEKNAITEAWRQWGQDLPRPRAVLVVSAHWLQSPPHLGPVNVVPLTYDFYGFPDPLYRVQYPSPPAPKLTKLTLGMLEDMGMKPGTTSDRGLDHGAWVPLLHLYPEASIPILQISIGTGVPMHDLLSLGKALAPLRSRGVFILGSGNIVHNLRNVNFVDRQAQPETWASEFDAWCANTLERFDLNELADYSNKGPGARMAHPTDDHFTPLLVAAAAAGTQGKPNIRYPYEGFDYQNLSMRCVEFQ